MLEYSSGAYKDIQSTKVNQQIYTIHDKRIDVQCYVRVIGKKFYITFRGTDSLKDWLTNFQFWKKPIPYKDPQVRVHTGFINAYSNEVKGKIHKLITEDSEEIIISGHSYGAALAILCAEDLQNSFPQKNYEVFLFGSPRVGNKAFKELYDKRIFRTFRISNGNDIISKIPFRFMGYRHVGIAINIGFPRILGLFSLKNHKLSEYYASILKSYLQ